jgi:hypothetical protein
VHLSARWARGLCCPRVDLEARLMKLYDDLGNMQGALHDSGTVGRVFNSVLAEVKERHPGDPVVDSINEVGFSLGGQTTASAEALRTVVGQLLAIVRGG